MKKPIDLRGRTYDNPAFENIYRCGGDRLHERAANRLYLTQPTVSQAIHDLEEHYHVQLFERLHKKLYITEEGRELLNLALMAVGN